MGGLWRGDFIGWLIVAALLPPAAVIAVEQGPEGILRMAVVLVVGLAWQALFRANRGVPWSPSAAVMAVAVALLGPLGLSPVQLAIGASFGIVLAELVFGGWGRNFVCASCAALAMLFLTHPAAMPPLAETSMVLASAASALVLLGAGILSLSVVSSALLAALAVTVLIGAPVALALSAGAVAFGIVFLLADPVAAPTTIAARVVYGAVGGGLIALLAGPSGLAGAERAVVFAVLLAQVFSPAFDYGGIALKRLARRRRHV